MQRLVARSCLGVNGDSDRDMRESVGARPPPFRRQWKEEAEAPGHLKHSDEIPSTLYVCLSLKFHSWADGIVPL